jgi:predicted RNA-binding Zn-ribbon protein involved in translation (DUF1610 family)
MDQAVETLAAICPECGLSILFDPAEFVDRDDPDLRDVMCAWCGHVTRKEMLRRQSAG